MQQPWQSYTNTMTDRIANARPERLMAMLYEGAVTRIKQAQERFAAAQPQRARESIVRAMRILDALMDHINLEEGGETAKNLERVLYFAIMELSKASRSEEPRPVLDDTLRALEPLHHGWEALATQTEAAR